MENQTTIRDFTFEVEQELSRIKRTKPSKSNTVDAMIVKLKWLSEAMRRINLKISPLIPKYADGDDSLKVTLRGIAIERVKKFISDFKS